MKQEQINHYSELMDRFLGIPKEYEYDVIDYTTDSYKRGWYSEDVKNELCQYNTTSVEGSRIKLNPYSTDRNWLHRVWEKFRDLKFNDTKSKREHRGWLLSINSCMGYYTLSEAFLELGKGLEWYYSLNKQS